MNTAVANDVVKLELTREEARIINLAIRSNQDYLQGMKKVSKHTVAKQCEDAFIRLEKVKMKIAKEMR